MQFVKSFVINCSKEQPIIVNKPFSWDQKYNEQTLCLLVFLMFSRYYAVILLRGLFQNLI
jgi:hypothetical protein